MIQLQKWDAEGLGLLTPEAVAKLYQPAYKFRVSHLKSLSHTPFCGTGVGFMLYVLSGSCTVALDWASQPLLLRSGEFCCVPRGGFVMSFPEPIEYMKVLELPEEVWSRHEARWATVDGSAPCPAGPNNESPKRLGPDEPPETYRIDEIVRGLRQTLSDDMARKAYGIRHKRQPTPSELTAFKELLINEHYDEGFDRWVEKYLYYDPRNLRT